MCTPTHSPICTHTFIFIQTVMERSLTGIPPSIYQFMYSSLHSSFSPGFKSITYFFHLQSCLFILSLLPSLIKIQVILPPSPYPVLHTCGFIFMPNNLLEIKGTTCLVIKFVTGKQPYFRKSTEGYKGFHRSELEG